MAGYSFDLSTSCGHDTPTHNEWLADRSREQTSEPSKANGADMNVRPRSVGRSVARQLNTLFAPSRQKCLPACLPA